MGSASKSSLPILCLMVTAYALLFCPPADAVSAYAVTAQAETAPVAVQHY